MHTKILAKYDRMRQMLADRNLSIANTSRLIDDIPTRTELIQYERRFVELYDQVALRLEETRKYYETYNILDETRQTLKKEVNILNSITDNFEKAMKAKSSKEEFLKQLQAIVAGIQESTLRQKKRLEEKVKKANELQSSYQNLVDMQRSYFQAVKEFQEECTKNEFLVSKLEAIQSK